VSTGIAESIEQAEKLSGGKRMNPVFGPETIWLNPIQLKENS
jgi:hypothetical protein